MSTAIPGSRRFNAERYLRHAGRWVACTELAEHLGCVAGDVANSLLASRRCRVVEGREQGYGTLEFRFISTLPAQDTPGYSFSGDWPPGFVSRFFATTPASFKARAK